MELEVIRQRRRSRRRRENHPSVWSSLSLIGAVGVAMLAYLWTRQTCWHGSLSVSEPPSEISVTITAYAVLVDGIIEAVNRTIARCGLGPLVLESPR
jgi:hypothetical protein